MQEDGLLYVLGGCVTVVEREEFPARLNLDLAFRLLAGLCLRAPIGH